MGSVGVPGDSCLWEVCNLLTVQFIESLLMSICTYEPTYDFLQDGDAVIHWPIPLYITVMVVTSLRHFLPYPYPGCPPCLDSHGIQTSTQTTTFSASIHLIVTQVALCMVLCGWPKAFWTHPSPSDMPCPFSTCRRHPRCILCALHVPLPQPRPHACATAPFYASQCISMHPTPSQHAATIPDASRVPFTCPSPSHDHTHVPRPFSMHPTSSQHASHRHCPKHVPRIPDMPWPLPTHVPAPQHIPCALHVPADGEWGRLYVWPVNSLVFHPVCIMRVCLCTVATDPRTDTTRSHQRVGMGWCQSGITR